MENTTTTLPMIVAEVEGPPKSPPLLIIKQQQLLSKQQSVRQLTPDYNDKRSMLSPGSQFQDIKVSDGISSRQDTFNPLSPQLKPVLMKVANKEIEIDPRQSSEFQINLQKMQTITQSKDTHHLVIPDSHHRNTNTGGLNLSSDKNLDLSSSVGHDFLRIKPNAQLFLQEKLHEINRSKSTNELEEVKMPGTFKDSNRVTDEIAGGNSPQRSATLASIDHQSSVKDSKRGRTTTTGSERRRGLNSRQDAKSKFFFNSNVGRDTQTISPSGANSASGVTQPILAGVNLGGGGGGTGGGTTNGVTTGSLVIMQQTSQPISSAAAIGNNGDNQYEQNNAGINQNCGGNSNNNNCSPTSIPFQMASSLLFAGGRNESIDVASSDPQRSDTTLTLQLRQQRPAQPKQTVTKLPELNGQSLSINHPQLQTITSINSNPLMQRQNDSSQTQVVQSPNAMLAFPSGYRLSDPLAHQPSMPTIPITNSKSILQLGNGCNGGGGCTTSNNKLRDQESSTSPMVKVKKKQLQALQQKIKKLQKQLINNKIFLNMVIHDMRNPTNSIEFAVKEILQMLSHHKEVESGVQRANAQQKRTKSQFFKLEALEDRVAREEAQKFLEEQQLHIQELGNQEGDNDHQEYEEEEKVTSLHPHHHQSHPLVVKDDQSNSAFTFIGGVNGSQYHPDHYFQLTESVAVISPAVGGHAQQLNRRRSTYRVGSKVNSGVIQTAQKAEQQSTPKLFKFQMPESVHQSQKESQQPQKQAEEPSQEVESFSQVRLLLPKEEEESKQIPIDDSQIQDNVAQENEQSQSMKLGQTINKYIARQKSEAEQAELPQIPEEDVSEEVFIVPQMKIQEGHSQMITYNDLGVTSPCEAGQPLLTNHEAEQQLHISHTTQGNNRSQVASRVRNRIFLDEQEQCKPLKKPSQSQCQTLNLVMIPIPVGQAAEGSNLALIGTTNSQTNQNALSSPTPMIQQQAKDNSANGNTSDLTNNNVDESCKIQLKLVDNTHSSQLLWLAQQRSLKKISTINYPPQTVSEEEKKGSSSISGGGLNTIPPLIRKEQTFGDGKSSPFPQLQLPSIAQANNEAEAFTTTLKLQSNNLNENNDDLLNNLSPNHQAMLQEIEDILQNYQDRGFAITEQKRNEIESLLRNSVFSSTMLLNLINDLLDLAKIENSSFKLNGTYFDLFEVIEKAADTIDSILGQKKIIVTHLYEKKDMQYFQNVYGDPHRYLQILLNFLSNAVKFTPEDGTITIQTVLKDKQAVQQQSSECTTNQGKGKSPKILQDRRIGAIKQSAFLQHEPLSMGAVLQQQQPAEQYSYIDFEIKIIDSGCGISPENLSKLFMNFSKLEEHSQMNHRGTGLGLSICKSLLELMGGSVSVESEIGKGTTFIMSLKSKSKLINHLASTSTCQQQLRNSAGECLASSLMNNQPIQKHQLNDGSRTTNNRRQSSNRHLVSHAKSMNPMQQDYLKGLCQGVAAMDQQANAQLMMQMMLSAAAATGGEAAHIQSKFAPGTIIQSQPDLPMSRQKNHKGTTFGAHVEELKQQFPSDKDSRSQEFMPDSSYCKPFLAMVKQMQLSTRKGAFVSETNLGGFSAATFAAALAHVQGDQSPNMRLKRGEGDDMSPISHKYSPGSIGNLGKLNNMLMQSGYGMSGTNQPGYYKKLYRALVANDDIFQLKIIERILLQQGQFFIEVAENGLVAVEKCIANKQGFDLIILDLDMPIMSGYEASKKIRSGGATDAAHGIKDIFLIDQKINTNFKLQTIMNTQGDFLQNSSGCNGQNKTQMQPYLVALSGYVNEEIIQRCLDCGFDDVIECPLTLATVNDKIIKTLETRDAQALAVAAEYFGESPEKLMFDEGEEGIVDVMVDIEETTNNNNFIMNMR